jgi:hypothetical protein
MPNGSAGKSANKFAEDFVRAGGLRNGPVTYYSPLNTGAIVIFAYCKYIGTYLTLLQKRIEKKIFFYFIVLDCLAVRRTQLFRV